MSARFAVLLWLLVYLIAAAGSAASSPTDAVAGNWEGTIQMPGAELGVIVNLTRNEGNWTGTIDIPMQGARALPLENISVDGASVSFAIKGIPGAPTFDGKLDEGRIEGTFTQGAFKLPFSLSRDKVVTDTLVRPQEPKPPFPYREIEVTVPAGEHDLAGTLVIPPGEGPKPVAIFITGSGPQNRDEELFGHKPFKLIADRLARAGIASLRCDDRGTGQSTGRFDECTSEDFANDVEAQIRFLSTRSDLNASTLGLIGHSEGGLIAPMVAARNDAVGFLVLIAPPGVPGSEILARQLELISRSMGVDQRQIGETLQVQAEILAAIASDDDPQTVEPRLSDALGRLYDLTPEGLRAVVGAKEEFVAQQIDSLRSPWMRAFVRYDPRPALGKVRQPVLAIWGGLDLQVEPAQNLPEVEAALSAADNPDVTLKTFDGLNHLMQPATTGSIAEYAQIETTMDEAVLEEIVGWITARFLK